MNISSVASHLLRHQLSVGPDFVVRWHWEVGDLVVWDNRCTMHCATGGWVGAGAVLFSWNFATGKETVVTVTQSELYNSRNNYIKLYKVYRNIFHYLKVSSIKQLDHL